MKIKLEANTKEQKLVLEYLENNASESLIDKINNGIKVDKDNKQLISKKDLNGFMKYANDEARKLAEKGANYACVEDNVVFGWAIHYFEEDSITGTLYNQDGTEYKEVVKTAPQPKQIEKPKEKAQQSLFDIIETKQEEPKQEIVEDDEDWSEEDINDCLQQESYTQLDNNIVDTQIGEVIEHKEIKSIDKDDAIYLHNLFDGKLEIR